MQPLLTCGHHPCSSSVVCPQPARQTYMPAPLQQQAEAHEAWQPAGFLTLPCGPCRPRAAPAAIMWPLPSSCGLCLRSSQSLAVRQLRTGPLPLLLQPRPQLPCRVRHGQVWGGPCSSPESTAVSSGKSSNTLGEIRQRPAYITNYLFCTRQSCLTFTLE
jgi:hypothetical protein